MTKVKYQKIPEYEQVDLVGKTYSLVAGTIDRKKVKRALITEQAGFEGKHEVVAEGADGTPIRTVEKIDEEKGVELIVEFVGGVKSLASKKVFKGYTAKNPENPDVTDLFVDNTEASGGLVNIARRMSEAHPECDGQWMVVDKATNGRVFIRIYDPDLKPNGKRACFSEDGGTED